MCNTIAAEFVCNNFSRHTTSLQEAAKEKLSCFSIPAFLKVNINYLAVLINRTPKIMLFAIDLDEYLVQKVGVAETRMSSF